MQPYCITAVKIFHSWSTVATAAQLLAVHKGSSGFEGRTWSASDIFVDSVSNVQLSTNDEGFRGEESVERYVHDRREKFATPKSIFFTCPNISHIWKQEKPTTTTLNCKKER